MTTEELRFAAEMVVATGTNKDWADTIDAGAVAVCRAWLAEHPADDGDAITPEWLQAVGFRDDPTRGHEGGPVNVWVLSDAHGEPLLTLDRINSETGGWDAFFGTVEDWNQFPREPQTRGDVRALCRALRIPLKEPAWPSPNW